MNLQIKIDGLLMLQLTIALIWRGLWSTASCDVLKNKQTRLWIFSTLRGSCRLLCLLANGNIAQWQYYTDIAHLCNVWNIAKIDRTLTFHLLLTIMQKSESDNYVLCIACIIKLVQPTCRSSLMKSALAQETHCVLPLTRLSFKTAKLIGLKQ